MDKLTRMLGTLGATEHGELLRAQPDRLSAQRLQGLIQTNPCVLDELASSFLDEIQSKVRVQEAKPSLMVYEPLTTLQQEQLRTNYMNYNLMFASTSTTNHPYSRAEANIGRRFLVDVIAAIASKAEPAWDVRIKSVGDKPQKWFNGKARNVHVCAPVVNADDVPRYSQYLLWRDSLDTDVKVALGLESAFTDGSHVCHSLSQNCAVTSEFLLFLNSVYDLTLDDIGKICDISKCRVAYGNFVFTPRILEADEGKFPNSEMHWRKFLDDKCNRMKIEFYYPDDVQCSYVHDYETYLCILNTSCFSVNIGGELKCFSLELFYKTPDVVYFRVAPLSTFVDLPGGDSRRHFTVMDGETARSVVLYTWTYDTLPKRKGLSYNVFDHMRAVRHVIPRTLYEKLYEYGISLGTGSQSFSLENLKAPAISFNNRFIVNAVDAGVAHRVPPDVLIDVIVAVFVLAFIRRYEMTQAQSQMIKDEQRVRDQIDRNWFYRFFCWNPRRANLFSTSPLMLHSSTFYDHDYGTDAVKPESLGLVSKLAKSMEVYRAFPILVSELTRVVPVSLDEEQAFVTARNDFYRTSTAVKKIPQPVKLPINSIKTRRFLHPGNVFVPSEDPISVDNCVHVEAPNDGHLSSVERDQYRTQAHLFVTQLSNHTYLSDDAIKLKEIMCHVPLKKGQALDLSVGRGGMSEVLLENGWRVSGTTYFRKSIDASVVAHPGFTFVQVEQGDQRLAFNRFRLWFNLRSFDLVVVNLPDHVLNVDSFEWYSKFVKRGGSLLLRLPMMDETYMKSVRAITSQFQFHRFVRCSTTKLLNPEIFLVLTDKIEYPRNPISEQTFFQVLYWRNVILNRERYRYEIALSNPESLLYYEMDQHDFQLILENKIRLSKLGSFISGRTPATEFPSFASMNRPVTSRRDVDDPLLQLENGKYNFFRALAPDRSARNFDLNHVLNSSDENDSRSNNSFASAIRGQIGPDDIAMEDPAPFLPMNRASLNYTLGNLPVIQPTPEPTVFGSEETLSRPDTPEDDYESVASSAHHPIENLSNRDGVQANAQPAPQGGVPQETNKSSSEVDIREHLMIDLKVHDIASFEEQRLEDYIMCRKFATDHSQREQPLKTKRREQDVQPVFRSVGAFQGDVADVIGRCSSIFPLRPVPNDGHDDCGYYALRDVGLFDMEPNQMRQHIRDLGPTNDEVYRSLHPANEGHDRWLLDSTLMFLAARLRIRFCVHYTAYFGTREPVTIHIVYGDTGDWYHLRNREQHWEALVPLSPSLPLPDKSDTLSEHSDFSGTTNDRTKINRTMRSFSKRVGKAKDEYCRYVENRVKTELAECSRTFRKLLYRNEVFKREVRNDKAEWFGRISGKPFGQLIKNPTYAFQGGEIIPFDNLKRDVDWLSNRWFAEGVDYQIHQVIKERKNHQFKKINFHFIQAAPGVGKTTRMINEFVKSPDESVFIVPTREGRADVLDRASRQLKRSPASLESRIRTVGSVLINGAPSSRYVFFDEVMMQHPGCVFHVVQRIAPERVMLVGDLHQIPFIDRSPKRGMEMQYNDYKKFFAIAEIMCTSYRMPRDVTAIIAPLYAYLGQPLRTYNAVIKSLSEKKIRNITEVKHYVPDHGARQFLTYTQAEKNDLINFGLKKVATVHEFQGCQANHVVLVRLRTDPKLIYDSAPHNLVALTRHTKSFLYLHANSSQDYMTLTIRKSIPPAALVEVGMGAGGHYANVVPSAYNSTKVSNLAYPTGRGIPVYFCLNGGELPFFKPTFAKTDVESFTHKNIKRWICLSGERVPSLMVIRRSLIELRKRINTEQLTIEIMTDLTDVIDLPTLTVLFTKVFPQARFVFHSRKHFEQVSNDVAALFNIEGIVGAPSYRWVPCAGCDVCPNSFVYVYDSVKQVPKAGPIQTLQLPLDERFDHLENSLAAFDAYQIHNSSLEFDVDNLKMNLLKGFYTEPRWDTIQPRLSSPLPWRRKPTLKEILLSLLKRNKKVPELQTVVDHVAMANDMCDALFEGCLTEERLRAQLSEPIEVNRQAIHDWLKTQELPSTSVIVPTFPMSMRALNKYKLGLKTQPKPRLDENVMSSYQPCQTLVFSEKDYNAIFCPIFNEIKRRFLASLRDNVYVFTGYSLEDFENQLNANVPPSHVIGMDKIELDVSKYDKSQGSLTLEFEMNMMKRFGVPQWLIDIWCNSHVSTYLKDPGTGLSTTVDYQRKTGDPSTYIGNTMFLMGVVSYCFPMREAGLALFSGDDSLFYGFGFRNYEREFTMATLFNLEAKFFHYHHALFCSKFLVDVGGRWAFVPDPMKILVKLGRHDLVNEGHLEEFRRSYQDLLNGLKDEALMHVLSEACHERYFVTTIYPAVSTLATIADDDRFKDLFYIPDGAKLNPYFGQWAREF